MANIQPIVPCLWFDKQAEEAVNFYTSIFKNSKIGDIAYFGDVGYEQHHQPKGLVMTIEFEINGQPFTALNGGPFFKFNESISLQIMCETQEEIDDYWNKLSLDGDENAQRCGWLKDKYGLSWQIVPNIIRDLMVNENYQKRENIMNEILKMKKIDIHKLKESAAQ